MSTTLEKAPVKKKKAGTPRPNNGGVRPGSGPKTSPGGGRLIVVQTKVTADESLTLEKERIQRQKAMGKPFTMSELVREKLFPNG